VNELKEQPFDNFIIDGEIVALEKGVSSFSKLQQRHMSHRITPVYYFVFDLIYWNGYDLRELPLIERKQILRKALLYDRRIRYTNHIIAKGESYFEKACRSNWEGIIAKRSDSRYVSGRSRDWLKFKCCSNRNSSLLVTQIRKEHVKDWELCWWGSIQITSSSLPGK
jgi:ATP-dependent DNA ligase